ncbi:MAG: response regulator [Ignavibacteriales bacterium]|nr:response regulator [Ignavibacteriales bacterium]
MPRRPAARPLFPCRSPLRVGTKRAIYKGRSNERHHDMDTKKIALVDDDETIRKTFALILGKKYRVSSPQGLRGRPCDKIKGSRPDLVIADFKLPYLQRRRAHQEARARAATRGGHAHHRPSRRGHDSTTWAGSRSAASSSSRSTSRSSTPPSTGSSSPGPPKPLPTKTVLPQDGTRSSLPGRYAQCQRRPGPGLAV